MPDNDTSELKIQVKINSDTKQLEILSTQLSGLEGKTQKWNTQQKAGAAATGKAQQGLQGLAGALGLNIGAFTGVAGAAAALGKVVKDSIDEYNKELSLDRQLTAQLGFMGKSYDSLKGSIDKTLKSLRANTIYTSTDTKEAFTKALKITGDVNTAYKLLKTSMDVAAASGKSQEEVMQTFNTALASGARGTTILAREFGKLGARGKTAAEIINNMSKSTDGARTSVEGTAKATAGLTEMYQQMTGSLGKELMPVMSGFITIGKVLLFAVLTPLSYALAAVKAAVDSIIEPFRVLIGFMTDGLRGANEAISETARELREEFKNATDTTVKGWSSMSQTSGKVSKEIQDAQIKAIKNVEEADATAKEVEKEAAEVEKEVAKEAAEEIKKEAEEAQRQAEKMVGDLSGQFDTAFKTISQAGNLSKETLDTVWQGIYDGFKDMLIKMVAEMLARQALIGILSVLSGGGVGAATSLLSGLAGSAKGAMDTGGTVPQTGMYMMRKGEKVSTGGSSSADTRGFGGEVHVHVGVQAFDLRTIAPNQINHLARAIMPHIRKEMNR